MTDDQFAHRKNRFPRDPPATKEVLYPDDTLPVYGLGFDTVVSSRLVRPVEINLNSSRGPIVRHVNAWLQGYMYRKIFEELFPTPAALETVPIGPSIACSTSRAMEWDESFKVIDTRTSTWWNGAEFPGMALKIESFTTLPAVSGVRPSKVLQPVGIICVQYPVSEWR